MDKLTDLVNKFRRAGTPEYDGGRLVPINNIDPDKWDEFREELAVEAEEVIVNPPWHGGDHHDCAEYVFSIDESLVLYDYYRPKIPSDDLLDDWD